MNNYTRFTNTCANYLDIELVLSRLFAETMLRQLKSEWKNRILLSEILLKQGKPWSAATPRTSSKATLANVRPWRAHTLGWSFEMGKKLRLKLSATNTAWRGCCSSSSWSGPLFLIAFPVLEPARPCFPGLPAMFVTRAFGFLVLAPTTVLPLGQTST